MRVTSRRGTKRCDSAPTKFRKPEITELFPAASAAKPVRATFSALSRFLIDAKPDCPAIS